MAWRVNYGVNHPDETATFRLADGLELFIQHHGDHVVIRQEGDRTVGLVVRPVAANVIEVHPDAQASADREEPTMGKGNGEQDPNQGRQPSRQEQADAAQKAAEEANRRDQSGNGDKK